MQNLPAIDGFNDTSGARLVLYQSGRFVHAPFGVISADYIEGLGFTPTGDLGTAAFQDYETGTWTPTPTFSTPGDLSVSYATRNGLYTKIGNVVSVFMELSFTPTFTTASGPFLIQGLPIVSSAPNAASGPPAQSSNSFNWPGGRTTLAVGLNSGGNSLVIRGLGSGGNGTLFSAANLTSGAGHFLFLSIQYPA